MKPETEKQLSTILDDQQRKTLAATQATAEAERTSMKNVGEFSAIKQDVIKPAFQEIINMFKRRGIPIYMREKEQERNQQGGTDPASISLEMYEQRPFSGGMSPEFKFLYYMGSRKLSFFTSTRSQGGPAKDVPFEAVTVDWIQEEFAKYAKSL